MTRLARRIGDGRPLILFKYAACGLPVTTRFACRKKCRIGHRWIGYDHHTGADHMEIDTNKIDDAVLALLYLTRCDDVFRFDRRACGPHSKQE